MESNIIIQKASDGILTERKEREAIKNRYYMGIQYLDDAMQGIVDGDLIVIGAITGLGKTSLIIDIAYYNAIRGKKIYLIALESKLNEIERRIKYKYISKAYYDRKMHEDFGHINYKHWIRNLYSDFLDDLELEAEKNLPDKLENFNIIYRKSGDFGLEELRTTMEKIKDDADLIILDHLHIFDLDPRYENQEIKIIMKELRDMTCIYNKPIIVVSHLRKNMDSKQLMPSEVDLHGSSDISKIGYTIVLLGRYDDEKFLKENSINRRYYSPTLIRICKDRDEGSFTRYVACQMYDIRNREYDNEYHLAEYYKCKDKFEYINYQPYWAKNMFRTMDKDSMPF